MLENKAIATSVASTTAIADDAVGVAAPKWFIAIVNNRSEKSSAEKLTRLGIESYVPVVSELRIRANGKRATVEKVMIASKLFIRCTERQRREIVNLPFIFRFMTNKAATRGSTVGSPLAVVPDHEIEQLKFMLGVADAQVAFTERFVKGDKVRVSRGPFQGLIGVVVADPTRRTGHLYVDIDFLGSAYVEINPKDVAPFIG